MTANLMRGLSLSQPWLWAMLYAGKDIENRDWQPPIAMIGKTIALHAAKSFDDDGVLFFARHPRLHYDRPTEYPKSAILGVATIDRIVTDPKSLTAAQRQWFFGPFGWVLTGIRALPRPIPWDGALGLWVVPPIVDALIRRQLDGDHVAKYLPPYVAALAAAGFENAEQWAKHNPGVHLWFEYDDLPSCVACGKVKPRDTAKNPGKPCKGVVGVELRGANA